MDGELALKRFDVLFDAKDELGLVLANGAADVGPDEEGVEAGEDEEHLVGILSAAQLIAQTRRDARLHAVDALFVAKFEQQSFNSLLLSSSKEKCYFSSQFSL